MQFGFESQTGKNSSLKLEAIIIERSGNALGAFPNPFRLDFNGFEQSRELVSLSGSGMNMFWKQYLREGSIENGVYLALGAQHQHARLHTLEVSNITGAKKKKIEDFTVAKMMFLTGYHKKTRNGCSFNFNTGVSYQFSNTMDQLRVFDLPYSRKGMNGYFSMDFLCPLGSVAKTKADSSIKLAFNRSIWINPFSLINQMNGLRFGFSGKIKKRIEWTVEGSFKSNEFRTFLDDFNSEYFIKHLRGFSLGYQYNTGLKPGGFYIGPNVEYTHLTIERIFFGFPNENYSIQHKDLFAGGIQFGYKMLARNGLFFSPHIFSGIRFGNLSDRESGRLFLNYNQGIFYQLQLRAGYAF